MSRRCALTAADALPISSHPPAQRVQPDEPVWLEQDDMPNPFNPLTRIDFELPAAGSVDLAIFDAAGRRVVSLVNGSLPAGPHRAIWIGQNDQGRAMASGVYYYRLQGDQARLSRRMTLLR
ncbi:MAG: FlgD immunoglobulin-like domain containing protein [bacterium]